jgi:hypothetical protein
MLHNERADIRQHCFIQALQLSPGSSASAATEAADAWVNLGLFYLQTGERELARISFEMAQSSDPQKPVLCVCALPLFLCSLSVLYVSRRCVSLCVVRRRCG